MARQCEHHSWPATTCDEPVTWVTVVGTVFGAEDHYWCRTHLGHNLDATYLDGHEYTAYRVRSEEEERHES